MLLTLLYRNSAVPSSVHRDQSISRDEGSEVEYPPFFRSVLPWSLCLLLDVHDEDIMPGAKDAQENSHYIGWLLLRWSRVCCVLSDCLLSLRLRLTRGGSVCVCEGISISVGLGEREVSGLKHAGLFTQ